MYFVANEWIKLSTKRKCSIGVQILMVLLTIIVCLSNYSSIKRISKLIRIFSFYSADISLRLDAYVFIQIDFPLAMDTGRWSCYTKWAFDGNDSNCCNHLCHLLCDPTSFQFSHLRTLHPQFRSTIHWHLFHVKHFHVHFCHRFVWLLHSWEVRILCSLVIDISNHCTISN